MMMVVVVVPMVMVVMPTVMTVVVMLSRQMPVGCGVSRSQSSAIRRVRGRFSTGRGQDYQAGGDDEGMNEFVHKEHGESMFRVSVERKKGMCRAR